MENSGIYKITNLVNNKIYIGSAINFRKRKNLHLWQLRKNKHGNKYLQNAFNKYGEDSFEFILLTNYPIKDLLVVEQIFINTFNPEYNILKIAGSRLGCKHSEETKRKISLANKGNIASEETRKKLKQVNLGKKYTLEHVEKVRQANLGTKRSDETRARISKAKLGKKQSIEHINNRIKSTQVAIVQLTKDGEYIQEFDSIEVARKNLKLHNSNISSCCRYEAGLKYNGKITGGFRFMYKKDYKKINK